MIKSKRGLSEVIATILLILITVSAAAAVTSFIVPFVRDKLDKSTECVPYQEAIKFEEAFKNSTGKYNYNCYSEKSANNVLIGSSIKVQTSDVNLSKNIKGFDVVFSNEVESTSIKISPEVARSQSTNGVEILGDTSQFLSVPKAGETLTYLYHSTKVYNNAQLNVILKSGRTCADSDSIKIVPCNGVNL